MTESISRFSCSSRSAAIRAALPLDSSIVMSSRSKSFSLTTFLASSSLQLTTSLFGQTTLNRGSRLLPSGSFARISSNVSNGVPRRCEILMSSDNRERCFATRFNSSPSILLISFSSSSLMISEAESITISMSSVVISFSSFT